MLGGADSPWGAHLGSGLVTKAPLWTPVSRLGMKNTANTEQKAARPHQAFQASTPNPVKLWALLPHPLSNIP